MSSNAYLDALEAQRVKDFLTAINTQNHPTASTPPPPATTTTTGPTASAAAPTTGAATPNSTGGLLSDGQGGFIPAPGADFGDHYGIVAQMPDGRVVLNTPQGPQAYGSPALAQQAAQQQGIPYQPALPITGNATTDQLNGFNYGVKADGTPQTQAGMQAAVAGMKGATGSTDSDVDKSAMAYLTNLLKKYGLDSLAGWAMDQLKSGASEDEIIQSLRDRPEYKARFAGMDMRTAAGLGPLSEDEYMAFEETIKDYTQRAGITGYTTPAQLANLIGNFANVGQVADRIQKGYEAVSQAPPEVRAEFGKWFGVNGDAAMAAYFLDPTKAEPDLLKQAQEAVIGGTGLRQGLDVSQQMAGSLADMGMSTQQIQSGFGQSGQLAGLQSSTIDEQSAKAAGLTADQIAGGVFGVDAQSTQDLTSKLGTRKAQFDTKGAAAASQKGAFGLEVAQ